MSEAYNAGFDARGDDRSTRTIHDFTPETMMSAVEGADTTMPAVTNEDIYREIVGIRNDIGKVVALVDEIGPALTALAEEAKEKGLLGMIPVLLQIRKAMNEPVS